MAGSARLSLPFLSVGQAQKEFTHNEALQLLDLLVAGAVKGLPTTVMPASPAIGDCYLVATGAGGAWAGKADHIAGWTAGGWRFVAPVEGMTVADEANGGFVLYRGGSWEVGVLRGSELHIDGQQVVGARAAAVPAPSGGAVVDTEARSAIAAMLTAMRHHGLIDS